eukprot:1023372-Pyramimonas_sp.AAC.1
MAKASTSTLDEAAMFFHWLPTAVPTYALNVGHVFDVKTFDSYTYMDLLFQVRNKQIAAVSECPGC